MTNLRVQPGTESFNSAVMHLRPLTHVTDKKLNDNIKGDIEVEKIGQKQRKIFTVR